MRVRVCLARKETKIMKSDNCCVCASLVRISRAKRMNKYTGETMRMGDSYTTIAAALGSGSSI